MRSTPLIPLAHYKGWEEIQKLLYTKPSREALLPFYKSTPWRKKRIEVLERDNNECQICKINGRYRKASTVHHIKELKDYPELAMDDGNLQSLCFACHETIHDRFKNDERKPKFMNKERW